MITLYYSPGACSLAPHIVLEEIGAPFTTRRVSIADGEHLKPAYLAINRHGRVPALTDGDFTLTEGPAILSWLGHRFPEAGLLDLADPNRLQYLVPNLVEAMFTGFPGNSGETVRISVAPENQRAPR